MTLVTIMEVLIIINEFRLTSRRTADQTGDRRNIDNPASIPTMMRFLLQHLRDSMLRA